MTEKKVQNRNEKKENDEIFMQYFCANPKCDCIFIDKDVKGKMTPVKGCYCPDCQSKYGYVNQERRKKKLSVKQKETLKKNQFKERKECSVSAENDGEV